MPVRAFVLAIALLIALSGAPLLSVTDVSAKRDRLNPAPCTVEPRIPPENSGEPVGTPFPLDVVGFQPEGWADTPEDLPQGEPANEETVDEITATVQEFAGCLNTGDGLLATAMLTDKAMAYLGSEEDVVAAYNEQAASDPRSVSWLVVSEVRELSDLRVGAVVTQGVLYGDGAKGSPQRSFLIFAREDGRWLLDGQINGNVDSSSATISPGDGLTPEIEDDKLLATARDGFMEVGSAMYAEPTLIGAILHIEAKVMVGFVEYDDVNEVTCDLFTIERGEKSATVTTFCRASEPLAGRAAYLDVDASSLRSVAGSMPYHCEDVAPLAAMVPFTCTVDLPPVTP